MKDTNQVQKALETKAKKELMQIVDEFVASLNKLNKTYRQPISYNLKESRSTEAKEFFYVMEHSLETMLHDMLIDAYLKPMVHKKTQELLNKLELI